MSSPYFRIIKEKDGREILALLNNPNNNVNDWQLEIRYTHMSRLFKVSFDGIPLHQAQQLHNHETTQQVIEIVKKKRAEESSKYN